jgi:hypothetical protein
MLQLPDSNYSNNSIVSNTNNTTMQPYLKTMETNYMSNESNNMMKKFGKRDEQDKQISEILDDSEKKFFSYLGEMHQLLTGREIDLYSVKNVLDAIEALKKVQEQEYLKALMYPERARGCKIPSVMPIPSSSFQAKSSFYISTNSTGNACLVINPFFLGATSISLNKSTAYLNNHVSLTGTSSNINFIAIEAGQTIPNVYNQYISFVYFALKLDSFVEAY